MRFRIQAKKVTIVAFLSVLIFSVSYFLIATVNYLQYFPAVSSLQCRTDKVLLQNASSSQASITGFVEIDSPANYVGLYVHRVWLNIVFENSTGGWLFVERPLIASDPVEQILQPRSIWRYNATIDMNSTQVSQLAAFNKPAGEAKVHALLNIEISSFLDPVTGYDVITSTDNLPIT